jgi:hypothetical protein
MSDTATAAKRTQKPRDVNYTLEIVDDLPDLDLQRRSPLEDQIAKIVDTPSAHGKFVRIASYANGSAASAAGNQLRKRHGDTEAVDGYTIRTKREVADDGSEPRTGLFVRYNPDAIVTGGREDFEKRLADREARTIANRQKRDADAKAKRDAAANEAAANETATKEAATPSKTAGNATAKVESKAS